MANINWTFDKVKDTFVDFFKERDHVFIPSSSVIPPKEDKSLLFTNAGMNQFKPIFLNDDKTNKFNGLKRAVNWQKCIRAGGKHNDLNDVGKDVYHHTYFNMAGQWSFGDYWKNEAIDFAFSLMVRVYGLDKERIYVTYFAGDKDLGLEPDLETRDIWLKYLPQERVLGFGMKDNFWEMGSTGPCGPCTEIHYDKIDGRKSDIGSKLVNMDDPTVIEVWNNVFMQFNRISEKELIPLKNRHVDTGLGLERLTAILQNKGSNYDIDVFQIVIKEIEKISNVGKYEGRVGDDDIEKKDETYRIIADHMRMIVVSLGDGLRPGSNKNENVLRLVIRRALKFGLLYLKLLIKNEDKDTSAAKSKEEYHFTPFLYKLVNVTCNSLEGCCPEFKNNENLIKEISQIVFSEEERYLNVLRKGLKVLKKFIKKNGIIKLSGNDAHKLWRSHGFPIELTLIEAKNNNVDVDIDEYYKIVGETTL